MRNLPVLIRSGLAVIELDGPSPHRVPVSRAKIAEVKARLGLARRNHHA
jgi:diguanylate cyclase